MSLEENRKAYNALNHKALKERMSEVMLTMIKCKNLSEEDGEIFHQVKEKFSQDELAYMSACFIGLEFKKALGNPVFLMLTQMLREAYRLCEEEKGDKQKQEDLMKKVMEILKN